MATVLPYNPQLDPRAIAVQGLGNMASRHLQGLDVQALQGLSPGGQFNPQSQMFQQMQAQGLMQALMPMNPYQQATLGIQQQQVDVAKTRARTDALGGFSTLEYWKDGTKHVEKVPNAIFNAVADQVQRSGGQLANPDEVQAVRDAIKQKQETAKRAIAGEKRAVTKEQRDIEDRRRAIAREPIEEFRRQQGELRAQRTDLRAEDVAAIPKGQMIADEWHEWQDGKLVPTGLKSPPRLQLTDVGEQKGVFNTRTGEIRTTEHPSAKVPSTQISIKQPPAKMLEDLGALYDMQDQVVEMAGLFDEDETFWSGRWEDFKSKHGLAKLPVIGSIVGAPTERGIMFRQIVNTLKEDLARKRSGGQITPPEFVRLDNLLPAWKAPPNTFKSKLKGFEQSLDRTVRSKRRVLREAGFIVPGETQVQGPKSVSAGRQPQAPSNTQMLNAINAATREMPGAAKEQIAIRAREILDNR